MSENRRLIEAAFPLNQVSLDSVHEKNVRHGHTSTLHILAGAMPAGRESGDAIARSRRRCMEAGSHRLWERDERGDTRRDFYTGVRRTRSSDGKSLLDSETRPGLPLVGERHGCLIRSPGNSSGGDATRVRGGGGRPQP